MYKYLLLFIAGLAGTCAAAQERDASLLNDLKPYFGFKLGPASTNFLPDKRNSKYDPGFNSITKGYPPRPGGQAGFVLIVPLAMRWQVGVEARYAYWQGQLNTVEPAEKRKVRVGYSTFEFPVTIRHKLKPDKKGNNRYLKGGAGYTYTVREYFHLFWDYKNSSGSVKAAHAIFVSSVYLNAGIATKRKFLNKDCAFSMELNSDFFSRSTRLIPNSYYVSRLPVKYVQAVLGITYFLK